MERWIFKSLYVIRIICKHSFPKDSGRIYIYRLTYQLDKTKFGAIWPTKFQKDLGWIFELGAIVKWISYSDFWQESKAHEFGFLDRSGTVKRHAGDFYDIIFLADSFVEGVQFPFFGPQILLFKTKYFGPACQSPNPSTRPSRLKIY